MNKKWMVIGLLLLGSTLQTGGSDSFQSVGHIPFSNTGLLQGSFTTETYNEATDMRNDIPFPIPLTDAELLQGSSITKTYDEATESESEAESMPNQSTYTEDEQYFEEEDTNINPHMASCSVTTLPISPHPLVIAATQSSEQNKRPRVNFHNSSAAEQPENLSVLATNIPQLKSELECPYCVGNNKEKFKANKDAKLIQHITNTHKEKNRFICWYENCHKNFNRQTHLKTHVRTHTGEKPFECKQCDKKFIQKGYLKTHVRIHTGEKPFKCTSCETSFSTGSSRNRHQKIHTSEKELMDLDPNTTSSTNKNNKGKNKRKRAPSPIPSKEPLTKLSKLLIVAKIRRENISKTQTHQCTRNKKDGTPCNKAFNRKHDLERHERTHTGAKPFKCTICKMGFAQKINLTTHTLTHTGEKPFKCTSCEMSFTTGSSRKRHMTTHR